jgi:hypothetical protein
MITKREDIRIISNGIDCVFIYDRLALGETYLDRYRTIFNAFDALSICQLFKLLCMRFEYTQEVDSTTSEYYLKVE